MKVSTPPRYSRVLGTDEGALEVRKMGPGDRMVATPGVFAVMQARRRPRLGPSSTVSETLI
jgi:hypothetical protein